MKKFRFIITLLLSSLLLHASSARAQFVGFNEVVHIPDLFTISPSTGAPTAADSTPTCSVYEEDTDTAILSAQNMTLRTSTTNDYKYSFTASTANGFENGKWYIVNCTATVETLVGNINAYHFQFLNTGVFQRGVAVTNYPIWMLAPGGTPVTSLTTAQISCVYRLDAGSWTALTDTTETEVGGSGLGRGQYLIDLTATETDGSIFSLECTGSGALKYRVTINTQH